ncbi:TIGR03862 family flavoprotein [Thiobacillus sp.]|uniref:TIGR03862 family flavoprotein n=1 Tax=Thiobacillus sp. TaxID=924 RepID=UPI0017BDF67F|nr:TIGR03862 family flavoprotein [Thiobacillus sp.]MBC2729254.1 TIGR03862 family flavoprotein [Thiobacillus sp.]MBC2737989.1 TIGR03862 family flavoprotein [Thiobacillus sp.]MBC2759582.1 TIGR03862 family flavoprotein [Thiobacillus sp.]
MKTVAVIGGGPAGLMAAEILSQGGVQVDLYDAMPSFGRKFLLAGVGGMNITHSEPFDAFLSRYGARAADIQPLLGVFSPAMLREWIHGLGVETFVGSSGRVFPKDMKAAPLLRAWLHRLRESGARFHVRHRWLGWVNDGALRFASPQGELNVCANAVVLALGGGSWAKLGSDGAWVPLLEQRGVEIAPLLPSNCGFDVAGGWSEHLRSRFAGQPLKTVALRFSDAAGHVHQRKGELMLSDTGVEGSLVYALSAPLRDTIALQGLATLELDLAPDKPLQRLVAEVAHPRGARSLSSHLQSRAGIKGVKMALLREILSAEQLNDPEKLAHAIKSLPLTLGAPRPLDEVISSAGGVRFEALDDTLMLRKLPGVFCAGEMLDWEAPTGGYLLTACLASGRVAGQGALHYLRTHHAATD